jgi:molecular chaperone DnaK
MHDDRVILGIDLGTTFSSVARVDAQGQVSVLPNPDGALSTPSAVYFLDDGSFVVGEDAFKAAMSDPDHVARFFKRDMGRADCLRHFHGRDFSPQELAGILLRKLKDDAEEALGVPLADAVLTVPARFNAAQRGATLEAGSIAGLNVLSMINEPTAAAIAWGVRHLGTSQRILVFDLGGGTLDVTLIEMAGSSIRTLASDGLPDLGGKDWDDRLVQHVAERFLERHGMDPRLDALASQELYERCIQAKVALSSQPQVVVLVNHGGRRAGVLVTREELQELGTDLVDRCVHTSAMVVEKAGLSVEDLDTVLLVGGVTRMPMIREALARWSGRAASDELDPEACVATGAALAGVFRHRPGHPAIEKVVRRATTKGARLAAGATRSATAPPAAEPGVPRAVLPSITITETATHPLGIIALEPSMEERVVNLIPEGSPLPVERMGRFAYAFDNMTAVRVEVTEGQGTRRDEVMVIGELILADLPPRARGTRIDVIYRYRLDQTLEVDIIDVETRISRHATIRLQGSLSPDGVAEARDRVAQLKIL